MDISVESLNLDAQTEKLPVRSERAPWSEIVPLRESRGEEVFVRKMTKALKKNLTRLKKSDRKAWLSVSWSLTPWSELSAGDEALRDFWELSHQSPESKETAAAFQAWSESRDTTDEFSVLECWYLLSSLLLNGSQLPDSLFWQVWNVGAEAFQHLSDQLDPPEGAEGELDQFLVASVELRWLAMAIYPEMENAKELPKQARKAFTEWSKSFFPEAGTPDAEDLPRLPLVWRSLARISSICHQIQESPFRKTDHKELRKLLTSTCRLAGFQKLLAGSHDSLPWSYLSDLGKEVTTKKQIGLRELVKSFAATGKKSSHKQVPSGKPSLQSDECAWASLRSSWKPNADVCIVRHHLDDVNLHLNSQSHSLLSGDWRIEIECEGTLLALQQDWEATCWHSDSDGDYLELEQKVDDQITLNRQLFLSRKDHFLYLSEIVHAPEGSKLTVRSILPVSPTLTCQQDQFTREWAFKAKKKPIARLFPVVYEQEIVNKTDGCISFSQETGLTLERTSTGSFYLPMVLDWHPHHLAAPAEWTKLTVTQSRHVTPASQAGGYRLRLAEQHLFMYRSLVKPLSPRAVLGEHTLNESLIGTFDTDGDVLPLLIVEE